MINEKVDVIELGGEKWEVCLGHPISYSIIFSPATNTFYLRYNIYNNKQIIEKTIKKETALIMLSRMDLNEEQEKRITEVIPEFEEIKLEIQMRDRLNEFSDKYILRHLNEPEYFHFAGERSKCRRVFPHPPHILGSYNTVRYGPMYYFCTGKNGILLLQNGKRVKLTINSTCTEDCWGTYVFEFLE